jgi:hypothetical protein
MRMNQENITTVIAVLGFILSVILGVIEIKRYRGRVRVKILLGHFFDLQQGNSEQITEIQAANIGYGTTYIDGGGWLKRDGSSIAILSPINLEFPKKVEERQSISIFYPCKWFKNTPIVENIVAAYVTDQTGKKWKCRLSKRNLQKLLKYESGGWSIGVSKDKKQYFRKSSETGESVPFYADGFMSHKINECIIFSRKK